MLRMKPAGGTPLDVRHAHILYSGVANKKPKGPSYKDVILAYRTEGVGAVVKLGASRSVLRAALQMLRTKGVPFEDLEDYTLATGGFGADPARTAPPQMGTRRRYRVMWKRTKQGLRPFIRIPLDPYFDVAGKQIATAIIEWCEDGVSIDKPVIAKEKPRRAEVGRGGASV